MDDNATNFDTEQMTNGTKINKDSKFYGTFFILVIIALSMVALLVIVISRSGTHNNTEVDTVVVVPADTNDFRTTLQLSVGGVDPAPLQNFFVGKVKEDSKDDETKSAIYWITHRYFDNGANIYEIYDFVEANPAISFLKEAEKIYPDVFADIKAGKVQNYSGPSMLALLAYYEVIDRYGYGDIALWGIAANKHAEMAYFWTQRHYQDPERAYEEGVLTPLQFSAMMQDRAMYYTDRIKEFLIINTQQTYTVDDLKNLAMIPDDLLVGLNQYSAAIHNIKSLGTDVNAPFTPAQIYAFNNTLASTSVPRLYFFTNYLYAASLVSAGEANESSVALPLERLVAFATKTPPGQWPKSVNRVIESKTALEVGMYDYETIKTLASLNPVFKKFLIDQGWTKADF